MLFPDEAVREIQAALDQIRKKRCLTEGDRDTFTTALIEVTKNEALLRQKSPNSNWAEPYRLGKRRPR
jgi:hypothetical protein